MIRRYLAYGSNMDAEQMSVRCPAATPLGVVELNGWRFIINNRTSNGKPNGAATVVKAEPESTVFGVLWEVTERCLEALDLAEGVEYGTYRRVELEVELEGRLVSCVAYLAANEDPGRPRAGYMNRVISGAAGFGLPAWYLDELRGWDR